MGAAPLCGRKGRSLAAASSGKPRAGSRAGSSAFKAHQPEGDERRRVASRSDLDDAMDLSIQTPRDARCGVNDVAVQQAAESQHQVYASKLPCILKHTQSPHSAESLGARSPSRIDLSFETDSPVRPQIRRKLTPYNFDATLREGSASPLQPKIRRKPTPFYLDAQFLEETPKSAGSNSFSDLSARRPADIVSSKFGYHLLGSQFRSQRKQKRRATPFYKDEHLDIDLEVGVEGKLPSMALLRREHASGHK